ncbi:hypothetical protein OAO87_01075 [bacterium]|nr:hypothetical protein [bacterium]
MDPAGFDNGALEQASVAPSAFAANDGSGGGADEIYNSPCTDELSELKCHFKGRLDALELELLSGALPARGATSVGARPTPRRPTLGSFTYSGSGRGPPTSL